MAKKIETGSTSQEETSEISEESITDDFTKDTMSCGATRSKELLKVLKELNVGKEPGMSFKISDALGELRKLAEHEDMPNDKRHVENLLHLWTVQDGMNDREKGIWQLQVSKAIQLLQDRFEKKESR